MIPMPPDRRTWGFGGDFGERLGSSFTVFVLTRYRILDGVRTLYICVVDRKHSPGFWAQPSASHWCCGLSLRNSSELHQANRRIKIVGGILAGLLAVACGWMGEIHHIGFTVSSRFSWGMRGSYFPVVLRVFVACMWFGMQAYWG